MKDIIGKSPRENKTNLAKKLGISRGMLYYQHRQALVDEEIKIKIKKVLSRHHAYGHKRIALELKLNKKRILRVMKIFGIKPYARRIKKPKKPEDEGKPKSLFKNEIENFCPIKPNIVWVGDFTYLYFSGQFFYLATIMDLFTREIVGWSFSACHSKELVMEAFQNAVNNTGVIPKYFHSDQGSEYDSEDYLALIKTYRIIISMSRKSSPWENGYQESFYSNFKLELGSLERFENTGELIEAISLAIRYYNHDRIHTKLKTSPVKYRLNYEQKHGEYLFKEMGT
jgi:transposase InsO family protein